MGHVYYKPLSITGERTSAIGTRHLLHGLHLGLFFQWIEGKR